MSQDHDFTPQIAWTGNRGEGTARYLGYARTWSIVTPGKPLVACSNDPRLGGDAGLHNPEDLLIASLSACHMLWYLHLASAAGIVVQEYRDDPLGHGESTPDGAGRFVGATLRPQITVQRGADLVRADAIHHEIGAMCFVARSVSFPVRHEATYLEV